MIGSSCFFSSIIIYPTPISPSSYASDSISMSQCLLKYAIFCYSSISQYLSICPSAQTSPHQQTVPSHSLHSTTTYLSPNYYLNFVTYFIIVYPYSHILLSAIPSQCHHCFYSYSSYIRIQLSSILLSMTVLSVFYFHSLTIFKLIYYQIEQTKKHQISSLKSSS